MTEQCDILIKNARIRGYPSDKMFNIAVSGDKIIYIGETIPCRASIEIDARGNLVTESLANPHIHLCKVYTLDFVGDEALKRYQSNMMEDSLLAIEIASRVKERYREDWIYRNARRAIAEMIRYGVLHVRAFADTDSKARLEAVKALLKLREELRGIVDLQVVAFPQEGLVRDEMAYEYVAKALEMGADVVGGIPWIEFEEDVEEHIERAFTLAKSFNRDIAMLTDDAGDPGLRTTAKLARATIRNQWFGRVSAYHARALALYPKPYLHKVIELSKLAGISYVIAPHTGPLYAPYRSMLASGINVALGQDDIEDAYYPYGRGNMLEIAFLASHITRSMGMSDIEILMDMITWRAKAAMNLGRCGLNVGCEALIVVHRAKNTREAISRHDAPLYVIRGSKIVAENEEISRLYIKGWTS
ncbi:MAG: amidohydrolase family protein [Sulfolobales archaeon]